ncbi:hypothetical protein FRC01_013612, partial [Tulasnella sp. 417]
MEPVKIPLAAGVDPHSIEWTVGMELTWTTKVGRNEVVQTGKILPKQIVKNGES